MPEKFPALRVLVVDDEPLIRWSLTETLVDYGCDVVEAGDGPSAIKAASGGAGTFDIVLLDLRLPDSNGLELLCALRRLAPRAQVILMTAFGAPRIMQAALDLGVFRVVSKPFEISELVALIREAHRSRPF